MGVWGVGMGEDMGRSLKERKSSQQRWGRNRNTGNEFSNDCHVRQLNVKCVCPWQGTYVAHVPASVHESYTHHPLCDHAGVRLITQLPIHYGHVQTLQACGKVYWTQTRRMALKH